MVCKVCLRRWGEDPTIKFALFCFLFGGSIAQGILGMWISLRLIFWTLSLAAWYALECGGSFCEDDCEVEGYDGPWEAYHVG